MKKFFLFAILFGILVSSCPIEFGERPNSDTEPENDTVTGNETAIIWVDMAIGTAIGTLLNKPVNAILPSDVSGITELNLSNKNINKLDDLIHFPALTRLVLSNNTSIRDLSPLSNLPKLTVLDLSSNRIGDLILLNELDNQIALASLRNLTTLNLSDNQIIDLTPLEPLTKLTDLDLNNNQIRNLKPLGTLNKLIVLDLQDNPIVNWAPVIHIPTVKGRPEIITWINTNVEAAVRVALGRTDNDGILTTEVTSITTLDLSSKGITNLADFVHLTGLVNLNVSNNQISDIRVLADLTKLTTLNLSENTITNWIPVAQILNVTGRPPHITWVDDAFEASVRAKLERPRGVILPSEVAGFTTLNFSSSNITKIDTIVHFTALTTLNLLNNYISDLTPLRNVPKLISIDLRDNLITDWTPIAHIPTVKGRPEPIMWINSHVEAAVRATLNRTDDGIILTTAVTDIYTLELSGKNITNLDDFAHLTGLTNLNLRNNAISDIQVLADLTKLTTLDISGNADIANWTPVSPVPTVIGRPPHITWIYGAFETAVRDKLDRPRGVILTSEVANIHNLDLSNENITNLDNIVHFTALTSLNLRNNSISDIRLLANLTNVVTLDLMSNNITDISTLANLPKLTALNLMNNYISDITSLTNLPTLSTVDLRDNATITNWLPISHVPTVKGRPEVIVWVNPQVETAIRVAINRPEGIILTSDLTSITTLDLSNKDISNLVDITYLTGITDLNLSNNQITNIDILADLIYLITLDLRGNTGITNWTPVAHVLNVTGRPPLITWTNARFEATIRDILGNPNGIILASEVASLTNLDVSNKNLTSLEDIIHFTSLQSINLSNNTITNVSPLSTLTTLISLNLTGNPITNWQPIAHILNVIGRPPHITWLDNAFENAIRAKLGRPSGVILTNEISSLTSLDLSNTDIANIADIAHFVSVTNLNMANNAISTITPLASLINLTNLNLHNNSITDLTPLTNLTNLTTLDLRNNAGIINWIPVIHVNIVKGRPRYTIKTTFSGYRNNVLSVAITTDGTKVVAGSKDRSIKLWDTDTYAATPLGTFTGSNHINAVVFSHDELSMISGDSSDSVRRWQLDGSGYDTFGLQDPTHTANVLSVAINHDETKVASGSADNSIKVWNATSRTLLHTLIGHTANVNSVAFSPDGTKIVSGSNDDTIKVWDAQNYTLLYTLISHTNNVNSVVFGPNDMIVSGSNDKKVKVWELNSAQYTVSQTLTGHTKKVSSVAITPDGSKIASSSFDKTVKLWEITYE